MPKENDLKISGNGVTKELKSLFKNSVCQPQTTLKNAPQLGSCYATVFFFKNCQPFHLGHSKNINLSIFLLSAYILLLEGGHLCKK